MHARVCIANDDGTNLVSLTCSDPANTVSIFPIVRYRTARNVLADFQQLPESGGCPHIVAFLVGVQVSKEHTPDWIRQFPPNNGFEEKGGGLTDALCRAGGSRRTPEA